jgi:hypothetical protein
MQEQPANAILSVCSAWPSRRVCACAGGVDCQYTSCHVLGVPNVADAFHALRNLVFGRSMYTLQEVLEATGTNR